MKKIKNRIIFFIFEVFCGFPFGYCFVPGTTLLRLFSCARAFQMKVARTGESQVTQSPGTHVRCILLLGSLDNWQSISFTETEASPFDYGDLSSSPGHEQQQWPVHPKDVFNNGRSV